MPGQPNESLSATIYRSNKELVAAPLAGVQTGARPDAAQESSPSFGRNASAALFLPIVTLNV